MKAPFRIGSLVTWSHDVPPSWLHIYTPGPMRAVSARWDSGEAGEYSQKFGGISRQPGWIITVRYRADSTTYYTPPLSRDYLYKEIHDRWLVPCID